MFYTQEKSQKNLRLEIKRVPGFYEALPWKAESGS
jgi:hypothetical protein